MGLFRRSQSNRTLDLRNARPQKAAKSWQPPKWLFVIMAVVITVTAMAGGGYFILDQQKRPIGKAGMERAVAAVGDLMMLPQDETPTYGTVADKNKVKDQAFFAKAENGDEILIYEKARLTILYRSSINKIVNVGPLVIGSAGSPYVTSKIAIKNGTSNSQYADSLVAKLKQLYPNAVLVSNEKASREYPATITFNTDKNEATLNQQIAESLKIQAGRAPLGEPVPAADFVIIIGQDYVLK
jgi:hypothetical protein